jgi:uncharacterized protein involved in exopolysaccharide biosynthesis
MELIDLLRVVRRWLWLIVTIVLVTELAVWFGTRSAESMYAATARLQISTPQREEVAAYNQYRFNPRDEIAVAINNFVELLQSDEVYRRTRSQLGLSESETNYTIDAVRASDADFVNVTVEAPTPDLVAEIANTHISIAIAYYGELRAQSTRAEQELFAEQLRTAEGELAAAEKALTDFRNEHGIYSLESQLSTQQRLIEQLQMERDRRLLQRDDRCKGTLPRYQCVQIHHSLTLRFSQCPHRTARLQPGTVTSRNAPRRMSQSIKTGHIWDDSSWLQ